MVATARDDRILIETRITAIALVPILLAAFTILYLFPDDTKRLFAWDVRPRMSALIMGAGYLTGAYFFGRMALARRWHRVGKPLPGVATFAASIMLVTVLHWDRFNHGHISFLTWVIVYAVAPPLVVLLWWRNRQADPGLPDDGDTRVPAAVRAILAIGGVLLLGASLIIFVWPNLAIQHWPWHLTVATARATAGWMALPGAASLSLVPEPRWSAWRMPMEGTFLWAALIAAGLLRAWGDFAPDHAGAWITIGVLVVWLVSLAALYAWMELKRRQAWSAAGHGAVEAPYPSVIR